MMKSMFLSMSNDQCSYTHPLSLPSLLIIIGIRTLIELPDSSTLGVEHVKKRTERQLDEC